MVYRLEVVYYSSYIFPFRLGTQLPVLSYVVGIYLDQASVIGKLFCGSKLSFYHNVSHNYAQTWCLRRKPFRLSQWVFRLSSPSSLSIDCMRKDCERTKLFLASFGRKSNIFHFCLLWVCIPFKLLLYLWLNRFFQEHPLPWFMARHMKDEVTFIFVLILLSVYVDKKQIHNAY